MRVLILASEFPPGPGGIGTHAYELARELRRLECDVLVVTAQHYASDDEVHAFNERLSFPVVRLNERETRLGRFATRWRIAARTLDAWRPDVLLATGARAVWLGGLLARRFRVPLLAMGHGKEFGERGALRRRCTRWAYGQSRAVVCVSAFTWRQMVAAGIRPPAGSVIHNGADPQRFRVLSPGELGDVHAELGLRGARLVVTVGHVSDRKGQDVVIRALPRILQDVPNAHYVAIGLPTRADAFRAVARELGVADHVHFLGKQDDERVVRILNAADVFAMTSRRTSDGDFEGYGIAVIEAALCGTPAVVTRDSGLAEAIVDGETGIGVPENDHRAVAAGIGALLLDDERRARLGAAARTRAAEQQTWQQKIAEYRSVLDTVRDTHARAAS